METPPSHKRRYYLMNTVIVCMIMLMLLFALLAYYWDRAEQRNKLEVTHRFIAFENRVQGFINDNALMLSGFSAYIDTFDIYNDDDVYDYLDNLLKGREEYINNVGIVKDTTILWNYPKKDNEGAIGTDLSKIPGQAEAINYVKTTLQKNFTGPVELVQGGTGYIIRVPIIKDDVYWGVASVVLKTEKMVELFDEYARESEIEVGVYKKSSPETLIYGSQANIDHSSLVFKSKLMDEDWTFCVSPVEGSILSNVSYMVAIFLVGLVVIAYLTQRAFKYFKNHEEIKNKNFILKTSAIRDKLTEIYNRNYLDIRILEEIKFANTYGSSVSFVYFDLNYFKRVNDTYGHAYGDSVLREIAAIVKKLLRKSDLFARWGGDEFAILMPNTSLKGAEIAAEKIRVAIEGIDHPIVGLVSASFGVAEYHLGESAESWFKRVDKALYHAKANKENSVCACDYEGNIMCVLKKE